MTGISVDEAKLYDRQIRLWGISAQTRMRDAKILIAGVTGLTNEVLKNLTLAGVGCMTLQDTGKVKDQDLGAQFFLRQEDVGHYRAECVAKRAGLLNPSVMISVDTGSLDQRDASFFQTFDMVCLLGQSSIDIKRVNEVCHELKIPFWAAGVNGLFGYIFTDLVEHTYSVESRVAVKDQEPTVTFKSVTETYIPFSSALTATFEGAESPTSLKRLRRKVNPLYYAYNILWSFIEENGTLKYSKLVDYKTKMMGQLKCHPDFLPDEEFLALAKTFHTEIGPACAILGGFFAQEVLKVLAQKEAPFNNFFCFDSWESLGFVAKLSV